MKKSLLIALCLWLPFFSNAQITINPGVDTTDTNIKEAIQFYTNYVESFKSKKILPDYTQYWSAADCKKYKVPDPSVYGIGGDYPTYLMGHNRNIHYVKPMKDGTINLKMTGLYIDSTKKFDVMFITNQYLKRTASGTFQFIQPIDFYQKNWQNKQFGQVNYWYPKYHQFDRKKARNLIDQIKKLETDWELKPKQITYFFANTYDEIQLIRGFDFTIGTGNVDKPMGISNQDDGTVFCAGNGEDYFHEVVHIYLNPLHQKSPLNEGLAVFYGGSLGKPLDWHMSRLQQYLTQHPEIDLGKLDDFYYMDNYTNPQSAIQGLLCKKAFQKDGIKGLKQLMKYESLNEIFEKEFGLDLKNLDKDLRKLIAERDKLSMHLN